MTLEIIPIHGLPEIRPGDDLIGLLLDSLGHSHERLAAGDVIVVAQKVVSKSEGRLVRLADVVPSDRARTMAEESGKDPRQLEVVLSETREILRWERGVLICETHHGFVCASDRPSARSSLPSTIIGLRRNRPRWSYWQKRMVSVPSS